jgi:hypothetical protein
MRSRAGSIIAALDIVTTRAKIPRVKCSSATTRRSRDAHTHCAARITSCLDRTPSGQPQGLIAYWGRSQVLSSGKRKEGKKRQNQHPKNVRYTRRPRSHEHLSDVNSNRISSAALAGKGTETSCIGKMTLGACSSLLFLSPEYSHTADPASIDRFGARWGTRRSLFGSPLRRMRRVV